MGSERFRSAWSPPGFGSNIDVNYPRYSEGFECTAFAFACDGVELDFGIETLEVWKAWCEMQTSVACGPLPDGGLGYACGRCGVATLNGPDPTQCGIAQDPQLPVDCGLLCLCAENASVIAVVKLKDGSLYRGTVIELVPSDHVTLQLPTGETRRFNIRDVQSVGAASAAPSPAPLPPLPATPPAPAAAPPPPSPPSPPSRGPAEAPSSHTIHFDSDPRGLRLLVRDGESDGYRVNYGYRAYHMVITHYREVCAAPCDSALPAGVQQLALAPPAGRPVDIEHGIDIDGPASLKGTYVSHRGRRTAGIITLAAGVATGAVLMFAGAFHTESTCNDTTGCVVGFAPLWGLVAVGGAVLAASVVTGVVLVAKRDEFSLQVVPQGAALPSLHLPSLGGERWIAAAAHDQGEGLGLRLTF